MSTAVSGLLSSPRGNRRRGFTPPLPLPSLPPSLHHEEICMVLGGVRALVMLTLEGGRGTRHFPSGPSERSITRTADQPASLLPSPEMQKCPLHITSPRICMYSLWRRRPSCANIVMRNEWGTSNERINRPRASEQARENRGSDRNDFSLVVRLDRRQILEQWTLSDEQRNLVAKILGPANLKEEL